MAIAIPTHTAHDRSPKLRSQRQQFFEALTVLCAGSAKTPEMRSCGAARSALRGLDVRNGTYHCSLTKCRWRHWFKVHILNKHCMVDGYQNVVAKTVGILQNWLRIQR